MRRRRRRIMGRMKRMRGRRRKGGETGGGGQVEYDKENECGGYKSEGDMVGGVSKSIGGEKGME